VKKAAELGLADAQFRLGEFYTYLGGHGTLPYDEKLSLEWITKAAQGGSNKAQLYLGRFYEDKESNLRDEAKANFWFRTALGTKFDPLLALKLDKKSFERPMQFFPYYPCAGSSSECGLTILGIGKIQIDSAEKLAALNPPSRITLVLHSPGGNLSGGLQLGEEIRKLQLKTETGVRGVSTEELGVLVERTICGSACSYAFLGGVQRKVHQPEALLFHQFSSTSGLNTESSTQEIVGLLNTYLDEMGVSRHALDPALLNRPEQFGSLSFSELRRYGVVTPDLTDDLTAEELVEVGSWRLDIEGAAPKITMSRPTDYGTGQVSLTLSKSPGGDKFILSVRIDWSDKLEQEYIDGGQGDMFKQESVAVIFCREFESKDIACFEESCKDPVVSLASAGSAWHRLSSRTQEISYELSLKQYELLLSQRPAAVIVTVDVASVHREMNICYHPYVLTPQFFKMANLMNK
jgi:hypothetical protein